MTGSGAILHVHYSGAYWRTTRWGEENRDLSIMKGKIMVMCTCELVEVAVCLLIELLVTLLFHGVHLLDHFVCHFI